MKNIKNDIIINASRSEIWDLLVNPKVTPEYMFTCAIESDFKIGSPVIWKGIHDNVVYVSGYLSEFDPENKMVYTVIDPNAAYAQTTENHLTVSYELKESENSFQLSVVQSGYETAAEGQARYDEAITGGGWSSILEKIKEMAEQ